MPAQETCPECGATLPAGAPQGLCARCFLRHGLQDETEVRQEEVSTVAIPPAVSEKPGDTIDRYKLLEKIGEGGFGVVYVAEQKEPVKRRVALKIIKPGMDTRQVVARFGAERQALALMDHPNIAKVLDAGTTSTGRPFFVMELVRGIKVTEYCDRHKLSTKARLDLFIQVCRAIQHAHQKGIIHRDIKPSNILVTLQDGVPVPKVIDFGIAKATQGELTDQTVYTQLQQFIGTPAYMSPEQAEMSGLDIDTRSDIYALGVLLYELLTGKTPFDAKELMAAGLDQIRRTIREKEPVRPSTRLSTMLDGDLTEVAKQRQTDAPRLVHLIRGDLDWVVMKCLEKDRARRYETANDLATDVKRHLDNEPVVARPPSQLYRFRKLVRRNKLAFAAGSAIAAALVIGLGLSTWLFVEERGTRQRAQRAEREQIRLRQQAEAEAAKSQQVARLLQDMLQGVGPSVAQGRDTTMLQEILDKTAQRVGNDLTNQAEVEAELLTTIGLVYGELGQRDKAEASLREALALRRKLPGAELGVATSLRNLGSVLEAIGKHSEARTNLEEALAISRRQLGNEDIEVVNCLCELLELVSQTGTLAETEEMARQVLAIRRKVLGREHKDVADSLATLAALQSDKGELAESEDNFREALAMDRRLLGERHPDVAFLLYKLAGTLLNRGKLVAAEAVSREALTKYETLAGKNKPVPPFVLDELSDVLRAQDKLAEAAALAQGGMAKREQALNERAASQPERPDFLVPRGLLRGRRGRWREAAADLSKVAELRSDDYGYYNNLDDHYLAFLAAALVEGGELEAHHRLCARVRKQFGGTGSGELATIMALVCLLVPSPEPADVVTGSQLADTGVGGYKGYLHLVFRQSCKALAEYRQGQFASAAEWALKALSQPDYGNDRELRKRAHCRRVDACMLLAMSNYQLHRLDEARAAFAKGLEIADERLPKIESGDLGEFWDEWIFAQVLMGEAKALIVSGSKLGGEIKSSGRSSLRKDPLRTD